MITQPLSAARAAKVAILATLLAGAPAMAALGTQPLARPATPTLLASGDTSRTIFTAAPRSLVTTVALNCTRTGSRMVC